MEKPLTAEGKLLRVFQSMDRNRSGTIELKEFTETMSVLDSQLFSQDRLKGMLEIADSSKDGIVHYEEFVEWLFGKKQQKMAMSVGTAALMHQLLAVEGNQVAENQLLEKIHTVGCCMIVAVHIDGPDQTAMLEVFKYLRALFALRVWDSEVRLIKSDGSCFFCYALTPAKALKSALKLQVLTARFGMWLDTVLPRSAHLESVSCSIGINDGSVVLIEGDVYGDPVNVASKLSEDIAEPGEILLSITCVLDTADPEMRLLLRDVDQTENQRDISGLTLHYVTLTPKPSAVTTLEATVHVPNLEETQGHLEVCVAQGTVDKKSCVVMTTDLSGFTRLTKQYGILHFLRLVLKCRSMVIPAVNEHGGRKIKYEGDNIIAEFPNTDAAMCALAQFWKKIGDFNNNRAKDFQIRAGVGLAYGEVSLLGQDIVGPGFDQSFFLAEEIAESGEILITPNMKEQGWPSLKYKTQVSEPRDVEKRVFKCCSVVIDFG